MQTALVIAHPGHELRVYGWVSLTQPLVFVLTDGSGTTGRSRVPSTRHILTETGARPGSIFGRFTDGAVYAALLDRNFNVAIELSEEIARELDAAGVELVTGDAVEGYNPVHDVCRLIINAAVARTAKNIRNYDFPLVGKPDQWRTGAAQVVQLDEPLLQRKLNAARQHEALTGEVDEAVRAHGLDSFREEVLRRRTLRSLPGARFVEAAARRVFGVASQRLR